MTEISNEKLFPIQNAGVFNLVMGKEENCKEFIERALNLEIKEIEILEVEKSLEAGVDVRGVRLDVFVRDNNGNAYNVEMQVGSNYKEYLGRRARYYQSMSDIGCLKKGSKYFNLPQSYVIFVCVFDPFDENRKYYSFRNYCDDNKAVELKDGTVKIFLYTKGKLGNISDKLQGVFDYINTGKPTDSYTEQLHRDVKYFNSDPKRREKFMTLQDELDLIEYDYEKKLNIMGAELAAKDKTIAAKEAELAANKEELAVKEAELAANKEELAADKKKIAELEALLAAKA